MEFRDLLDSLHLKASRWEHIGIQLGLDTDVLDIIKANYPEDVVKCLTEVLKKWYKHTTNPTWKEVLAALRAPALDEIQLAMKLEQKFSLGNDVK